MFAYENAEVKFKTVDLYSHRLLLQTEQDFVLLESKQAGTKQAPSPQVYLVTKARITLPSAVLSSDQRATQAAALQACALASQPRQGPGLCEAGTCSTCCCHFLHEMPPWCLSQPAKPRSIGGNNNFFKLFKKKNKIKQHQFAHLLRFLRPYPHLKLV